MQLISSAGDVLWAPPITLAPGDLPGRLAMQNDGNLVYDNPTNTALWATNTGNAAGASSQLILAGSYKIPGGDLSLTVYDYSSRTESSVLYSQS